MHFMLEVLCLLVKQHHFSITFYLFFFHLKNHFSFIFYHFIHVQSNEFFVWITYTFKAN